MRISAAVAIALLWAAPARADEGSTTTTTAATTDAGTPPAPSSSSAPAETTDAPPPLVDDTTPPPAAATTSTTATTASPATTSTTTPAATTPREHEDDGRKLDLLFIQAEGGAAYIDLTALSAQGRLLPSLTEFRGTGAGAGATVGFRVSVFALAAHGYIARFDGTGENRTVAGDPNTAAPTHAAFDIGQLMLEAQIRVPLPVVEPYIRAGFGYAWMGNFEINDMYRDSTGAVNGWTGKLGAGLDVWLGSYVSVGAGVDVTLLNLRRGGVMRADSSCPESMPTCVELRMDGDAVGLMTHFHANAALHF